MNIKINDVATRPRPFDFTHSPSLKPIPELKDLYDSVVASKDLHKEISTPSVGDVRASIEEGRRNNTLTSIAGSMRHRSMSEEAILAALMVENEAKCDPPLPEAEVRAIARSIGKYEAHDGFELTTPPAKTKTSVEFPVQVLPPTLRSFVEEASAAIGCPPEFVAVPMLATLGAAIGNSTVLELKQSYVEGATLYTAIVGNPGESKSPALNVATAPATRKQEELYREYQEAVAEYDRSLSDIIANEDYSNDTPDEPIFRRTVVQDTTVEALIERLGENARGLLSSNDELSGWVRQQDQYKGGNKGADRQFWLSGWSNNPVYVDRKGRKEPIMVSRPFVALTGGIQPGILKELKNDREDGLLDRFLFAFPNPAPLRWTESEVSERTMAAYEGVYDELYELEMSTDENGSPDPRHATFTTSAKQAYVSAFDSLCEETEHTGFPAYLKGPWSKMRAYLARLALIIGMARIVGLRDRGLEDFYDYMKDKPMISVKDVEAAIALIEYFKAHARKVYAELHGSKDRAKEHHSRKAEVGKGDDLAAYLMHFLADRNGYWEGMTSELYEVCKADSVPDLPGGNGPFGKQIRAIADDSDKGLILTTGHKGKHPIIKLSLPTAGTVGALGMSTDTTEDKEAKCAIAEQTEVNGCDPLDEIVEAMERLFEASPEHLEDPEPTLIALDLSFSGFLDYLPSESEVESALDNWQASRREEIV